MSYYAKLYQQGNDQRDTEYNLEVLFLFHRITSALHPLTIYDR